MNERVNRPAMGIATETSHNNKALYRKLLDSFCYEQSGSGCLKLFHDVRESERQPPDQRGAGW